VEGLLGFALSPKGTPTAGMGSQPRWAKPAPSSPPTPDSRSVLDMNSAKMAYLISQQIPPSDPSVRSALIVAQGIRRGGAVSYSVVCLMAVSDGAQSTGRVWGELPRQHESRRTGLGKQSPTGTWKKHSSSQRDSSSSSRGQIIHLELLP
jgi:hypothetical protein